MNNYEAIRKAADDVVSSMRKTGDGIILITGGVGLDLINSMSRGDGDEVRPDLGYRPVPSGKAFTIGLMEGDVLQGHFSVEIAQVGDGAEIYIDNMFVDADFRGKGVASRIKDALVSSLSLVAAGSEALKEGSSGHISPLVEGASGVIAKKISWEISDALSAAIDQAAPEMSDIWA